MARSELDVILRLRDQASAAMGRFGGGLQRMRQQARGASLAMGALAAGSGVAARGFISAALEQEKAVRGVRQAVENAGASWDEYGDSIQEATSALQRKTNFGDETQLRALRQMIPILGSTEKALKALPIVLDASASAGRGLEEVSRTLTRALSGQANTAESIGLTFDNMASFEERLTLAQAAVGGQAEATSDSFTQLGNVLGDLREVLGFGLIEALGGSTKGFRDFMISATDWLKENDKLTKAIGLVILGLVVVGSIVAVVALVIGALAAAFGGASVAIVAAILAIVPILAVDLSAAVKNAGDLFDTFEALVTGDLETAKQKWTEFKDHLILGEVIEEIPYVMAVTKIIQGLIEVWDLAKKGWTSLMDLINKPPVRRPDLLPPTFESPEQFDEKLRVMFNAEPREFSWLHPALQSPYNLTLNIDGNEAGAALLDGAELEAQTRSS